MKNKLQFSINIKASVTKVWEVLWNDETYREWTSAFIPGSYYKGELKEGSTILFLSPGEHGLFAEIEKVLPFQSMYFKHFGLVLDGTPQDKTFGNDAIEYYDLTEGETGTHLEVTLNADAEYITFFNNSFPRALKKVKEIAES